MRLPAKRKGMEMTHDQYDKVKQLQRIWFLRRLFGKKDSQDIVTKQAEIELAGQAAAKDRPPLPTDESDASLPEQDGV